MPRSIRFKTKPTACAGADPRGCEGEGGSWCRADGRGLWNEQWSAPGDHGLGVGLCGSHHLDCQSAPGARSSETKARQRRSLGEQPAQARLAHLHVARNDPIQAELHGRSRVCSPASGRPSTTAIGPRAHEPSSAQISGECAAHSYCNSTSKSVESTCTPRVTRTSAMIPSRGA